MDGRLLLRAALILIDIRGSSDKYLRSIIRPRSMGDKESCKERDYN